MNRYDPSTPHTRFALAAAAMSAITIGLAVALPAALGLREPADASRAPAMQAAALAADDFAPLRIEVIGAREAAVAPLAREVAAPRTHHAPLRTKAVATPKRDVTAAACPYTRAKVARES